jgi:signal transduction histidine kinase
MGLAICRKIVELLGAAWFVCKPVEGARFRAEVQ